MRKRVCSIVMSLVLLIYIPLSDYAAMKAFATSIPIYNSEVTAEVMMILWNLLMTGEIVSGVSQSNIGDYEWEKVTFEGFMDILAYDILSPTSNYDDAVVLVLEDGRHIDLFEFMVETGCWINENGELVDGTGALVIPSQETWEKYRVIDGGAGGSGGSSDGEDPDQEPDEDPFNRIQSVLVGNGLITVIGDYINDLWNDEYTDINSAELFNGVTDLDLPQYYFNGYDVDDYGNYVVQGHIYAEPGLIKPLYYFDTVVSYKIAAVFDGNFLQLFNLDIKHVPFADVYCEDIAYGNPVGQTYSSQANVKLYSLNIPVFPSYEALLSYDETGSLDGLINRAPYDFPDLVHSTAETLAPFAGINLNPNALPGINTALERGLGEMPAPGIDPAENTKVYKQTVTDILTEVVPEAEVSPDSGTLPDPNPVPGVIPGTDSSVEDYKVDVTGIFPFCIPFDFVRFIKVLSAEPVAPRFEFPFVVPSLGIDIVYVIDLSFMEDAMKVFRIGELVSFMLMLMVATRKVIKW